MFSPILFAGNYENCEFFPGPDGLLHILCQNHGSGQPHFVSEDALDWNYVGLVNTAPALEPTPVYQGVPGDQANVTYFIARNKNLDIQLFGVTWHPESR